jgi:hypothetical protein
MTVDMSGTRNGQPWPKRGTVVDLPDDEAVGYCEAGMAVPAAGGDVETATAPTHDQERRASQTAVTTSNGPTKRSKR